MNGSAMGPGDQAALRRGNQFLDITHSVGVAAWFALHRMQVGEMQSIYGPPGPFGEFEDPHAKAFLVAHRDN
jgi:hypothetical protein